MNKIAAAIAMALIAGTAGASTVQIQTGNVDLNAADGYAQPTTSASFQSTVDQAVAGASKTAITAFDYYQTNINSKAFDATITFNATTGGEWDFRAGVDFGQGGTLVLDAGTANAVVLATSTGNMWWAGDWNNSSSILAGSVLDLSVGTHTLNLFGIEDCCSGFQSAQFKNSAGGFTSFGLHDGMTSPVPEAQSIAMLLAGLGLVGTVARRRKQA